MRLLVLIFMLSYPLPSVSQSQWVIEDSLINFIEEKEEHKHWRIMQALSTADLSDSFKLKLYEIDYKINTEGNYLTVKSHSWKAIQALINQGIILEHMGADSSIVLDKLEKYS